jgi:glutamine amidotransferase
MQHDFGSPAGALYVPGGEGTVAVTNALRAALAPRGARVFLTQDWHPRDHVSFAVNNAGAAPFSVVVLPGVGAFGNAMQELENLNLVEVVRRFATSGKPLLGICLGMQLLLDESDEFGSHRGLSIIPGHVVALPVATVKGIPQKVPHIGWSALLPADGADWGDSALARVQPGEAVYFVHSYMVQPQDATDRFADCMFGGHRIAAVIRRGQVIGCQFHPEKSGRVGLAILRAFCALG